MPINLLGLPSLVQEIIYKNATYAELFLLSLLSSKMKKSIEQEKIKLPKLCFRVEEKSLLLQVNGGYRRGEEIMKLEEVPHLSRKKLVKVKIGENYEPFVRLKPHIDKKGTTHFRMKMLRIGNPIVEALQDHICSLFQYSSSVEMEINIETCSDKLHNFKNLVHSQIHGRKVKSSLIDHYFLSYPNHQSAYIGSHITGEISAKSPLFQIENLVFHRTNFNGSIILKNFVGRNLVLYGTKLKTSDIIEFLEKWVNSEAYFNLEGVYIVLNMAEIEPVDVSTRFELVQYDPLDPSGRPEQFAFDPRVINHGPREINLRDAEYREIRRKSDGKRAFMKCTSIFFFLFVES